MVEKSVVRWQGMAGQLNPTDVDHQDEEEEVAMVEVKGVRVVVVEVEGPDHDRPEGVVGVEQGADLPVVRIVAQLADLEVIAVVEMHQGADQSLMVKMEQTHLIDFLKL